MRVAARGAEALPVADAVVAEVAEVEQEWRRHLGEGQMARLRRLLTSLREITDPYA